MSGLPKSWKNAEERRGSIIRSKRIRPSLSLDLDDGWHIAHDLVENTHPSDVLRMCLCPIFAFVGPPRVPLKYVLLPSPLSRSIFSVNGFTTRESSSKSLPTSPPPVFIISVRTRKSHRLIIRHDGFIPPFLILVMY